MVHMSSLLIPAAVLLPNLLFVVWPPKPIPGLKETKQSHIYQIAEGIGRVGGVVLPLFSAIRLEGSLEWIALVMMLLSLGFYASGWIRYLRNEREYRYLYTSMLGIPVPMAVMPVLYFMSASLLLHSYPLMACSLIFGIGHIPASIRSQRSLPKIN
ncbi:hypothetical protein D3C81_1157370 [compost metagenome]